MLSTIVFAGIVWCIIYFMPNDGWLYWASIAGVIILAITYIFLIYLEYSIYEMSEGFTELYNHIKPQLKKFLANPFGCFIDTLNT